jgi:hypothetical protein
MSIAVSARSGTEMDVERRKLAVEPNAGDDVTQPPRRVFSEDHERGCLIPLRSTQRVLN